MTQKDNILQELNELKSSLAAISSQNVYTVPVGYFDGLTAQVLSRIKAMEAASPKEELSHLSPLLSTIDKQMPFTVPSGYFEGVEEYLVQSVIKNQAAQTPKEELETLSPLLSNLKKEVPYSVPQGYFDELAARMMQSVNERNDYQTAKEELETLSPLLSGLKKEMPYSVPQGYFEQLASPINNEENKPAAKVIAITSRKWFRYAAAAVVVGIVTLTGFLLLGDEKEPGVKALAKLSRDVKKMDETQKDNLIDFIDAGLSGEETVQANPATNSEIKDLLKGISEEELTDFQEQTEDIQDVLMTN